MTTPLMAVFLFFFLHRVVSFPCGSVTQFNVTFTFSETRECGTYLNGDSWVLADGTWGDLIIDSIDPLLVSSVVTDGGPGSVCIDHWDYDHECDDFCSANAPGDYSAYCSGGEGGQCYCSSIRHGYEINPVYQGGQSLDSRTGVSDPSLLPNGGLMPLSVSPGSSVVKVVSQFPENDDCSHSTDRCVLTAVVLTVVEEIPPADAFRPPYVYGEDKTTASSHIRYAELTLERSTGESLLPNLPREWLAEKLEEVYGEIPEYSSTIGRVDRLQLDHKGYQTGRALHPVENIPDYGASIASRNNDIVLLLCLNATLEQKKSLIIPFLQYGIDLFYMIKNNASWTSGGGHRPGQKLPLVFAAVLVDREGWKDVVRQHAHFNEEWVNVEGQTEILWGYPATEERYWNYITSEYSSNLELADPYGYIDGGMNVNHVPCGYQTCWSVWNDEQVMQYVDRYVRVGIHTRPDPCAPYDGQGEENLGRTFGPDPNHPGECIKQDPLTVPEDLRGRFPSIHGSNVNEGGHNSRFEWWMWQAYRSLGTICRYGAGTYNLATETCDCNSLYSGPECGSGGVVIIAAIVAAVGGVVVACVLFSTVVALLLVAFCRPKKNG